MATPRPLRVVEHQAALFRRSWPGALTVSVLYPLCFLGALGLGLGSLIEHRPGAAASLGTGSYLAFVAPGLLATAAMQTATTESTYPIMGAIRWSRFYHAMLATPLRTADLVIGHLLWVAIRLITGSTAFLVVMAVFGALHSPTAALAVPAGALCGLAFAGLITAFAATRENDASFNILFRFGNMPLFLFSGTFFPLSQLPAAVRPLAWVTPLWHGVDLCRSLTLGRATLPGSLVHVTYLLVMAVGGAALAFPAYRRRLTP